MSVIKAFSRRHPVLTYYILTFAVSWSCLLLVIGGPSGIPGSPEQIEKLLPFAILALLAGPSAAGLLLTGLVAGRAGYRELLSRLGRWKAAARWYAAALLTAPLVMTLIPLALSLFFPEFLPGIFTRSDRASLIAMGIAAGLTAGIFEELGWTGFAIPRLRRRYGAFITGLIAGFLWGGWHFIVNFWSSGTPAGELAPDLLLHSLIFSVGILPAYRVLMVRVYDETRSLLLAMLMHASLTAGNVILLPPSITGLTGSAWSLAIAAALWIIVAVRRTGRKAPEGSGHPARS